MLCNRALVALSASFFLSLSAGSVAAQNTCNGLLSIDYTTVQQPNVVGSIDRVNLTIGVGTINGGTTLNVSQIAFWLDCKNRVCSNNVNVGCAVDGDCPGGTCNSILPTCIDDGAVAGFAGNITTTCAGVTWTANSMGGATPNMVVLSANVPVAIPAGNTAFCEIEFDFEKLAGASNDSTPMTIEQVAGFESAMCNNGLAAEGALSGSVDIDTPQPDTVPAPATALGTLLVLAAGLGTLGARRLRRGRVA